MDFEDFDVYEPEDVEYSKVPEADETVHTGAKRSYNIISMDDIKGRVDELCAEIAEMFNVSHETAGVALSHYKWNKEKMLEEMIEVSEPTEFMRRIGIVPGRATCGAGECSICFEARDDKIYTLGCGHSSCSGCLQEYINCGDKWKITCFGCDYVIPESVVAKAAICEERKKIRMRALINDFQQASDSLHWCVNPRCEKVIEGRVGKIARCDCGAAVCLECKHESHIPASCEETKNWLAKAAEDFGNMEWLMKNSRSCPKCQYAIEKNGGCNHIHCKKCDYHFCWVCLIEWKKHSGNAWVCSRKIEVEKGVDREALERNYHYVMHYQNHTNAIKFYREFKEKIENARSAIHVDGKLSWVDTTCMVEAARVLIDARETLRWTYAVSFYMPKGAYDTVNYEANQADLNMAVEHLSDMVENPPKNIDPSKYRIEIQDRMRYIERRRLVFM